MGEDGNSIKVNLIKQDDGGSPIRHYLVKYRAVSSFRLQRHHTYPGTLIPTLLTRNSRVPSEVRTGQGPTRHLVRDSWNMVKVLNPKPGL